MNYHVACRVSGGVTGVREALLKDGNSTSPRIFTSLEEAEAEAASLSRRVNQRLFSTVLFKYWAVPA